MSIGNQIYYASFSFAQGPDIYHMQLGGASLGCVQDGLMFYFLYWYNSVGLKAKWCTVSKKEKREKKSKHGAIYNGGTRKLWKIL